MFWKKYNLTDDTLGAFEWVTDHWYAEVDVNGQNLSISILGSKTEFDQSSLSQAKDIIHNIDHIAAQAQVYLNEQDISSFTQDGGQVFLGAIFSKEKVGTFDIEFYLTEWEDACIIIHFNDNQPTAFSLGD